MWQNRSHFKRINTDSQNRNRGLRDNGDRKQCFMRDIVGHIKFCKVRISQNVSYGVHTQYRNKRDRQHNERGQWNGYTQWIDRYKSYSDKDNYSNRK